MTGIEYISVLILVKMVLVQDDPSTVCEGWRVSFWIWLHPSGRLYQCMSQAFLDHLVYNQLMDSDFVCHCWEVEIPSGQKHWERCSLLWCVYWRSKRWWWKWLRGIQKDLWMNESKLHSKAKLLRKLVIKWAWVHDRAREGIQNFSAERHLYSKSFFSSC